MSIHGIYGYVDKIAYESNPVMAESNLRTRQIQQKC